MNFAPSKPGRSMSAAGSTKYCGQVSRPHLQPARLGPRDLVGHFAAGDVEDLDRLVDQLGQRDGAVVASRSITGGRDHAWYFGAVRPSASSAAVRQRDRVVVLAVHGDERAAPPGRGEHAQELRDRRDAAGRR